MIGLLYCCICISVCRYSGILSITGVAGSVALALSVGVYWLLLVGFLLRFPIVASEKGKIIGILRKPLSFIY